jgi:hypothetical protein
MPKSPTGQPKEQLTIRFAERWMGQLRKRAEEQQLSMSDVVEAIVQDHFNWFSVPTEVAELLREDAKKSGRGDQREYAISLLMKRYVELVQSKGAHQKK